MFKLIRTSLYTLRTCILMLFISFSILYVLYNIRILMDIFDIFVHGLQFRGNIYIPYFKENK